MAEQPPPAGPAVLTKYSPNQEVPIASLASIAVHMGVAVALALLFTFVIRTERDTAMPVEAFAVEGDPHAGGGESGSDTGPVRRVERATAEELGPDAPQPNVSIGPPPDVVDLPDLPAPANPDRIFQEADRTKAKLDAQERDQLVRPKAGQGGPGSGGGKGAGLGPGTGTGTQPGTQGSIRASRNKRWTLSFSTVNGRDYLRQLSAMGAILVAEFADGARAMYRRLDATPSPAEPVDRQVRDRMSWVDQRPNAIGDLAAAMGLQRSPTSMRAYFPFEVEEELLKLELGYRGRRESEIDSTVFRVFLTPNGYRLVVTEQQYHE